MRLEADLILRNIGQMLTMEPGAGEGDDPGLGLVRDGALAVAGERIVWAGPERELPGAVDASGAESVDLGRRVAMPGLVDCHTHTVFAGSRAHEFALRLSGASYEEILASGGGIHATVQATRKASLELLVLEGRRRLDTFLEFGVTTVEVKSGYGLDTGTELKMLRAAAEMDAGHPVDVVPTLLGAHVVPAERGRDRSGYVDEVISEMIPAAAEQGLARFCDVFCDQGAFTVEETRRVLRAGLDHGLAPKIHGEQLTRSGSVDLAVELRAVSIDHLEHASREDAERLAATGTVAVLLPGATYFLGKKDFADGRMLADAGCKVAVSTDFNPGSSHTENLPLMLNMACLYNRLHPEEALLGATRHAACALALGDQTGRLFPGLLADVLVLDLLDYRDFLYHFGVPHTHQVYKRGKLAWSENDGRPCH